MWQYILGLFLVGVVAVQTAQHLQTSHEQALMQPGSQNNVQAADKSEAVQKTSASTSTSSYASRNARIPMDNRGHFITNAKMNGRQVSVLVDTGATSVAINRSTARRIGIKLEASDFKYSVHTANGVAKAAATIIDRISIGRVTVKNVETVILEDRALGETLLGMAFLRELKGFEVRNQELILNQ
ncbi:MAG: TIGR02281 family clan AA aspartic protease [Pseudomonadota bacterium]